MAEPVLLNNRYELLERLGSGGMAVVYKANDRTLARVVAIKVLRQHFSKDEAFREHFRQEARAAANLSHPNIVTVHDFGLDAGRLFIVMEFVPGSDLKSLIQRKGRFTLQETIHLVSQACAGIGFAHRADLVHCDVKPLNLLVSPDMRLKVTDFGIARALAGMHASQTSEVVWGSPQYFSPEQASGLPPTPASDVYSLGVILYEMLTGQLPFVSDDPVELAKMHQNMAPVAPRRINPQITPALEQIILKVLSKEPSHRYRTADQLGRVLLSYGSLPESPHQQPAVSNQASAIWQSPSPPAAAVAEPSLDIDWLTIVVGLITVIMVGGLVPFWLYIWFKLNTPIP
jgi:serine/threonine protein kinase